MWFHFFSIFSRHTWDRLKQQTDSQDFLEFDAANLWCAPNILDARCSETLTCWIQTLVWVLMPHMGSGFGWIFRNQQEWDLHILVVVPQCPRNFQMWIGELCAGIRLKNPNPKDISPTCRYIEVVQTNQWCHVGLSENRVPPNLVVYDHSPF